MAGVIDRLGFVQYLLLYLPAFVASMVAVSVIAAYFVNRFGRQHHTRDHGPWPQQRRCGTFRCGAGSKAGDSVRFTPIDRAEYDRLV